MAQKRGTGKGRTATWRTMTNAEFDAAQDATGHAVSKATDLVRQLQTMHMNDPRWQEDGLLFHEISTKYGSLICAPCIIVCPNLRSICSNHHTPHTCGHFHVLRRCPW